MQRDFTYIDDIVEGGALDQPVRVSEPFNGLAPDPACSNMPYRLFNIGNDQSVKLLAFIEAAGSGPGPGRQQALPVAAGWGCAGHMG